MIVLYLSILHSMETVRTAPVVLGCIQMLLRVVCKFVRGILFIL